MVGVEGAPVETMIGDGTAVGRALKNLCEYVVLSQSAPVGRVMTQAAAPAV